MNTNYIASAGTGKTFSLVCEVIKRVKDGESLEEMLILTFTEKAAGEIKERIYTEISRIIEEEKDLKLKKRLHSELLKVEYSYIGTFHSIFLRILKKYPDRSKIDRNTKIFQDSMLRQFILKEFENWIENDFYKNRQIWDRIGSFSGYNLFDMFYTLYTNRTKINKREIDLKPKEKNIENLKSELKSALETLFERYGELLTRIKQIGYSEKIFNNDPFLLKESVEEEEIFKIKPKTDRGFIFKGKRGGDKKSKEFFQKNIQPYLDEYFFDLDGKVFDLSASLYEKQLDFNSDLILDRFFKFLEHIQERKKIEGIIDFDDILIKMDNLLDEQKIRKELQKKFRSIFIDEFQDTDRIQISILKKISDNNLSVFGDPKQCIYQWRAADLESYFQFVDGFRKVVLENNYRSSPEIVNFLNKIFTSGKILKHISEEYRKPVKPVKEDKGEVKIKDISDTGIDQTEYIPALVKQISKNYSYNRIMILVRKNSLLKKVVESLQKNNIPVKFYGTGNLFETEEVRTVVNILKFIDNPENPVNLLKILKSPVIMEDEKSIYKNKTDLKAYKNPVLSLFTDLSKRKFSISPDVIIEKIYNQTDIIPIFSSFKDGKTKIKNLLYLKEIIFRLSRENYNLSDIILYAETVEEKIPESDDDNSVEVLTIHRAKGLQKEVVILPFFDKDPYRIIHRDLYYKEGELIINFKNAKSKKFLSQEEDLRTEDMNELERLLYVALTRAVERIYLIKSEKPKKNSFLKMLENTIDLSPYTEKVKTVEIKEDLKTEDNKPDISIEEATQFEEFLKREKEKATSFERFTSVSKMTEENQKIKKGNTTEKSLYTGILIHSVLEEIDFKDFSLEKTISKIKEKMDNVPKRFKKEVEKKAIKIMETFHKSDILDELKKSKIIFREVPFVLKEKDRFIEGRIDIIYEKDGKLFIMDYKTADFIDEKNARKKYILQKEYYLKAVKKIFPEKDIFFKIGMLSTGKIIEL